MDSFQARFGGVGRLYSSEGLERLRRAHVAVIGLGGVGSWAVEALARCGIGKLTLVDLDDICISNVNRQLHAIDGELGKPKVEVMARRVNAINPECQVHALQTFLLKSNADEILGQAFDYLFDAIDSPSLKCFLIAKCRERGLPTITTGGAGGRRDPMAVEITALAFTSHDRLMREVRRKLRRNYGFPRGDQAFGIDCVVSREPVVYSKNDGTVCARRGPDVDLRLDCASGYGTAAFVTGAFGFAAASRIVQNLCAREERKAVPGQGLGAAPARDAEAGLCQF